MAAEDVLMAADLFAGGRFLVEGADPLVQLAGRERRRLIISVFAESVTTTEQPPQNDAVLTGAICKPPIYRRTPLGREICDVMLAVPRQYQRTDYIPCILWGRTAQCAAGLPVGRRSRWRGACRAGATSKSCPKGPRNAQPTNCPRWSWKFWKKISDFLQRFLKFFVWIDKHTKERGTPT